MIVMIRLKRFYIDHTYTANNVDFDEQLTIQLGQVSRTFELNGFIVNLGTIHTTLPT